MHSVFLAKLTQAAGRQLEQFASLLGREAKMGLVGIWSKPKGSVACTARYRREERGRERQIGLEMQ